MRGGFLFCLVRVLRVLRVVAVRGVVAPMHTILEIFRCGVDGLLGCGRARAGEGDGGSRS